MLTHSATTMEEVPSGNVVIKRITTSVERDEDTEALSNALRRTKKIIVKKKKDGTIISRSEVTIEKPQVRP